MDRGAVGEVALVTGGASGIGRACVLALARAGAKVIVADVEVESGEAAVDEVASAGGTSMFVRCDVASLEDVESMVARGVEAYGRLDCAVNNAGIQGSLDSTEACTKENWDRTLAVNLTGVWHCMKQELPIMLSQGAGAIVNIASNFGLVGSAGMPAYSASKHGILGLTKTAALETARSGVRVNAICPGPVKTPLVDKILRAQPEYADEIVEAIVDREPIGRMGKPEEIAEAVVWLCSDAASFVTGAVLAVDGGFVAQ